MNYLDKLTRLIADRIYLVILIYGFVASLELLP